MSFGIFMTKAYLLYDRADQGTLQIFSTTITLQYIVPGCMNVQRFIPVWMPRLRMTKT